ncbi:site-specific recombinase XerC [Cylindrospermum stagnale PCC 7417]|uniref:Site-specific recombinase XerC n=1 Tax=Cylindrospermum stagnale PCC 7417 TaxID=56107 RepID=K9WYK6_9NOST|nr:tyrosine-type recombinase/integrase [Cylindrospermum stagnale]AFZ25455.1 site-specific recombinase XerC [Cylindrospermum stagnale PCC 7417]
MAKAPAGTVHIECFRDRLRLRFTHNSKQHTLALKLADTPVNRKVAEGIASEISRDLLLKTFDSSKLINYRGDTKQDTNQERVTIGDMFDLFTAHRSKGNDPLTSQKYTATLRYLKEFVCDNGIDVGCLADKPAEFLGSVCSEQFAEWVRQKSGDRVFKERIGLLNACWEWGKSKHWVGSNPWLEIYQSIKISPKQKPRPFTSAEVKQIIEAFQNDPHYKHYSSYVTFAFGTGMRTGELNGLLWKHISPDYKTVWVGESLGRGKIRKAAKNHKDRVIRLSPKMQQILIEKGLKNPDPESFVFTTRQGNPIDDHNFCQRAWKAILTRLGISYRKFYYSRSTYISHALTAGVSPLEVSEQTGHDTRTMLRDYAACIKKTEIPEYF